jgi:DNA polymerase-4
MDAFYASTEVLDDPSLEGKPVIVGGMSNRGVVSAASYEARVFGVHSAMPIFQAKRLCPNGVYLPPRFSRYREVSRIVMGILADFSPLVEQVSIDEAYIDLTGSRKLFGDPGQMARAIKDMIREKTSLTCSIGVANSKLLAKIASDIQKPDGLTIIAPRGVRDFLDSLPIGKVPGIGAKSQKQLSTLGVKMVGQIKRLNPALVHERFGKFGKRLLEIASGIDTSPVVPYTPPKSISTEMTLSEDTKDLHLIRRHLKSQSEKVARRLRKHEFVGRTVTLKLKYSDFKQVTRSVTLDSPTPLGKVIYEEAVRLLEAKKLRSKVRLVGVGVSNLESPGEDGQMTLFYGKDSDGKWEKAEKAVDEIVKRFGEGSVKPGTLLEEHKRENDG